MSTTDDRSPAVQSVNDNLSLIRPESSDVMRILSASSDLNARKSTTIVSRSRNNDINFSLICSLTLYLSSSVLVMLTGTEAAAQSRAGKKHNNADLIDLVGLPRLPLPELTLPQTKASPMPAAAAASAGPGEPQVTGSVKANPAPAQAPARKGPVRVILQPPHADEEKPVPARRSSVQPSPMPRQPAFSMRTPDPAALDHLLATLPTTQSSGEPRPIRLQVAGPLPPRRPVEAPVLPADDREEHVPATADVSRPDITTLAAIGAPGTDALVRAAPIRATVLPQASPPISHPVAHPAPAPSVSAPEPAVKQAANAAAHAPAVMPAPANVQTADAGQGEPAAEAAPRRRRIPMKAEDQEASLPKLSSEWELPRAPRRTARPALNRTQGDAPALPTTRIAYVVRNQSLDQLVREIGQIAGVRVVAGPGLRGAVRERRLEGPFNTVLDRLARDFNLFWFSDGNTVYVDPLDEQKTKFFKVRGSSPAHLEQALDTAGLSRYRDRIQTVGSDGLVRVSGPDNFLRVVEAALTGAAGQESGTVQLIKFGQRVQ